MSIFYLLLLLFLFFIFIVTDDSDDGKASNTVSLAHNRQLIQLELHIKQQFIKSMYVNVFQKSQHFTTKSMFISEVTSMCVCWSFFFPLQQ